jgi:hypothetical protein
VEGKDMVVISERELLEFWEKIGVGERFTDHMGSFHFTTAELRVFLTEALNQGKLAGDHET